MSKGLRLGQFFFSLLLGGWYFWGMSSLVQANSCVVVDCSGVSENERPSCLGNNITCLNSKISEAKTQAVTLESTIALLGNEVKLLQSNIEISLATITALEGEIKTLNTRINSLNQDLDHFTTLLLTRVVKLYKSYTVSQMGLVFSPGSLTQKVSAIEYLRLTQARLAANMKDAEAQRLDFAAQKSLKEQKQLELEAKRLELAEQKTALAAKKQVEESLLQTTRQSEAQFQQDLARQKAEFLAIQAICSGQGQETEIRQVASGEKIGSLIDGASCNSSGRHLHFSIREKALSQITGQTEYFCKNPFSYLKSDVSYLNCSGGNCNSDQADPFVPSGSWSWPVQPKIFFYQGFGATWSVKNVSWLPYEFHNGLDIEGQGLEVLAVSAGKLFSGFYKGIDGCQLPYLVIRHENSNLDSLYLHVNF